MSKREIRGDQKEEVEIVGEEMYRKGEEKGKNRPHADSGGGPNFVSEDENPYGSDRKKLHSENWDVENVAFGSQAAEKFRKEE